MAKKQGRIAGADILFAGLDSIDGDSPEITDFIEHFAQNNSKTEETGPLKIVFLQERLRMIKLKKLNRCKKLQIFYVHNIFNIFDRQMHGNAIFDMP